MKEQNDVNMAYKDRPANIHEKIIAGITSFAYAWVIIDLIIAQSALGVTDFAVRQWVWFVIISFSWLTMSWPVLKKYLVAKKNPKETKQ